MRSRAFAFQRELDAARGRIAFGRVPPGFLDGQAALGRAPLAWSLVIARARARRISLDRQLAGLSSSELRALLAARRKALHPGGLLTVAEVDRSSGGGDAAFLIKLLRAVGFHEAYLLEGRFQGHAYPRRRVGAGADLRAVGPDPSGAMMIVNAEAERRGWPSATTTGSR